jgi:hypothetical protein
LRARERPLGVKIVRHRVGHAMADRGPLRLYDAVSAEAIIFHNKQNPLVAMRRARDAVHEDSASGIGIFVGVGRRARHHAHQSRVMRMVIGSADFGTAMHASNNRAPTAYTMQANDARSNFGAAMG